MTKRAWLLVLLWLFLPLAVASAGGTEDLQSSKPHNLRLGVWTSGGAVANDHGRDTRVWNAGFHVGRILRGQRDGTNLEYAAEFSPAFVVFQSTTVYGVEAVPMLLRWTHGNGKGIRPYAEIGGGLLFTHSQVPEDTSRFNFTPQARFGLEFPRRENQSFLMAFQYVHISNANLAARNRGYNTLQLQIGYLWFR